MDHSELGETWNGFRFKFLEPGEYDQALKFLEKYLYQCLEPVGYKQECLEDWNFLFRLMMEHGPKLSYIAVDEKTGEIAACRMVNLISKEVPPALPPFKHESNLNILKLFGDICAKEDLFGRHGITKYPDMFGLAVDPKHRQKGLASEMYRRGFRFLKKRGFEIVKVGFINTYSRKAGLKNGYEEFARRKFGDCKDDKGNVLNAKADPNDYVCFGVFDLRKLSF